MTDAAEAKFLELFPAWLKSLGEDARLVGALLGQGGGAESAARALAGGLNYIFKSLDLIPDGIDDLGFMDDAFVLRVSADLAQKEGGYAGDPTVARLSQEAKLVSEFLGADYARLETYVRNLKKGAARGRTVDDILQDEATRQAFLHEVDAWAKEYTPGGFTRDIKTLIKLRAFLNAKLP